MLRQSLLAIIACSCANAELIGTFIQGDNKDIRIDRIPAIFTPKEESITPFLSAGKFEAEWKSNLVIKERSRLVFSFEGFGSATLLVNGKEILSEQGTLGSSKSDRLRLNPGEHEIIIKYTSADDGSANFRIYWESNDMVRQTIAPTAFTIPQDQTSLDAQIKRRGRAVFAEQKCAKCHASETGIGAQGMPELTEIGPVLAGAGDRVSVEWLQLWIADPKALKPTTHMPSLLDPTKPEDLQKAADLAAYVAQSKIGTQAPAPPDKSLAQAGGLAFHELGCISCHQLPGNVDLQDPNQRIPLNNLAFKFLPGQLEAYLKKPEAFNPHTAMPNFQLTDKEAASLASFLHHESLGKQSKTTLSFPVGDPARGLAVSESLHCGTCHPGLTGAQPTQLSLDQIFKVDWLEKGCASENDKRQTLAKPNLKPDDRKALVAFSKLGSKSLQNDNPVEFAQRQIVSKRCVSCHALDNQSSLLDSLHASTADLTKHVPNLNQRVAQSRPQLTFIGEMLHTNIIEKTLSGNINPRSRPWLGMRMPAYAAHATPFAQGLSRLHGFAPSSHTPIKTDPQMVEIGKKLMSAEGFGCTTCHGVGDMQPTAAFEVGAINFAESATRLREGYYHRWMDHPAGVIPGNKMPRYAEGNNSPRVDILDGDAYKQYNAIWQWIQSLPSQKEGK